MDYFQGVVTEFLRAKRSMFVNTECLIQLDVGNKQIKDRHWYCDAVAVDLKESTIYLCEITYSSTLQSLIKRLHAWRMHWSELSIAILRDSGAPKDWQVQPWVFIPEAHHPVLNKKFAQIESPKDGTTCMPKLLVTHLENVLPWVYKNTWDLQAHTFQHEAHIETSSATPQHEQ
jgi:hypothetical protein